MITSFFSERELGKSPLIESELNEKVYNGILTIYEKYKLYFAKEFPVVCPDNNCYIYALNERALIMEVQALIPDLNLTLKHEGEYIDTNEMYALLDFIEYCYDQIYDVIEGEYHGYFGHYHCIIKETREFRDKFRTEINRLFERNRIVFYLNEEGEIKRRLPLEMDTLIKNINLNTVDKRLNELIVLAIESIAKPKLADRAVALEKIWDAFERMKTYYSHNKSTSAKKLVSEVTKETEHFYQIINIEFNQLTKIGNAYQIRHFETNKIEIKSPKHIDYLFYRMLAVINLCVATLSNT